jgi:hypothetical protein
MFYFKQIDYRSNINIFYKLNKIILALTGFGLPSFIFLFGDVLDSMGVVKNIDDTIE